MILLRDISKDHILDDPKYAYIDPAVIWNMKITDGAKVLYTFLVGLKVGEDWDNLAIAKALNIQLRTVQARKRELKKHDLICVHQIGYQKFMLFVGTTIKSASQLKEEWKARNFN